MGNKTESDAPQGDDGSDVDVVETVENVSVMPTADDLIARFRAGDLPGELEIVARLDSQAELLDDAAAQIADLTAKLEFETGLKVAVMADLDVRDTELRGALDQVLNLNGLLKEETDSVVALTAERDAALADLARSTHEIETLGVRLEWLRSETEQARGATQIVDGEQGVKARKFPAAGSIETDALRAAISLADKVEVAFVAKGKEVLGILPVWVMGDAWADHAYGLRLKLPITLIGAADAAHVIDGYGLLLDGQPTAYAPCLSAAHNIAPGQRLQLDNEIFF